MCENSQTDESISVIIRIKGRTSDDLKEKSSSIKITNNNSILIDSKKKEFFYDYIGNEYTTQNDIFEHCGKKICDYSLEGYNGTIFAYGQTGSGKTYTLLGKNITCKEENKNFSNNNYSNITGEGDIEIDDDTNSYDNNEFNYNINDEKIGLLPRILYYLFQNSAKNENKEEHKFIFKISYLEIYKENIMDLLYPDNKEKVQLSDINGILDLKNLRKLIIGSPEEAIKYIIDGNHFRHTGSTLMNKESSRSHAIISIYIENHLIKENKIKKSVFHVVDLAGSERQKKTGTYGDRIKEAGSINKSLLNLSIVIQKIINNQKPIPYRDSKLTHLLRDSLGGNAKTSIIATISQLDSNLDETISTLNFAQNAKKIKNRAIINEELSASDAKILKEKFKNLQINYNLIFRKYDELKKEYQNHRNNTNEQENISKSLEIQNEDINRMMKDIEQKEENVKKLKEENDSLRDKIEKYDIEFKLKDADINQMKQKMNIINEENKILSIENKNLKNNINKLEEKLNINEEEMKKIEENYKKEKIKMEENYNDLQSKNLLNDDIKNELREKIKENEKQIQSYIEESNKSKIIIEEKENEIREQKLKIIQIENQHKELDSRIGNYIKEVEEKNNKLEEVSKNNIEIKIKGKNMLEKYNEVIIKNKEEVKLLKETLFENNKKINKINEVIKVMEEEKEEIKEKLNKAQKNISEYLETIALLHQQNITYEKEKKLILKEKEQLEKKLNNIFEPFSSKISLNKSFNLNNSNVHINNSINQKEYIQLKKEYDKLKNNYEDLIKNIEPKNEYGTSKIRKIQDLSDKLNLIENDLNEYKTIIKNSIKKIGEYINININNDREKYSLINKFEYVIQLVVDYTNNKNIEIQHLNEQKEILLKNIKTNNLKKELFEFLNKNNNNINNTKENKKNDYSIKINKIREGYLSKKINSKNSKIINDYFYSNEVNENNNSSLLQENKENNYNVNNIIRYTQ